MHNFNKLIASLTIISYLTKFLVSVFFLKIQIIWDVESIRYEKKAHLNSNPRGDLISVIYA